ncbi:beta-ketoacyl synthase N-terminal-like domain-containing protein [Kitasatospora sp. NPDC051984]|uniref:beta-ketoacyl synthase N-terminal-like domain-containing protein n=1 Tax=Kitasatospora sp. NPDC051984 TaxID=3364059 RepID=UPI0037C9B765
MSDVRTRPALAVVGYAETVTEAPEQYSRNSSSLFADPLAWLMSGVCRAAVADCDSELAAAGDLVGVITVSEICTLDTMRLIARATPRGRLSPLKFAGANPGSLAGLTCIRDGFRGPSLTLSMPPAAALPTALDLAASWLEQGTARHVLVGTHQRKGDTHAVRCAVLRSADAAEAHPAPDLIRLSAPVRPAAPTS